MVFEMFEKPIIKTESLDPIHFENNIPTKCGEFYVTKFGQISIVCGICFTNFGDLTKFTEHIIKGHLRINNITELEEINISNTLEIEYLEENILYQPEFDINEGSSTSFTNNDYIIKSENIVFEIKKNNDITKEKEDQNLKENIESGSRHLKKLKIETLEVKKGYDNDKSNENLQWFNCKSCSKKFQRQINLEKHEAKHKMLKYNCNFCGKFFSTNFEMKQHVATHTKEKPFICEECGASFNCKGNLKNHYLTHSNYRPHECNFQCGKSFKTSRERVWHERIHTGEKPYQCEQCGDSFAHQHKLKLHKNRIHMDPSQRPHKCVYDGCVKAFLFPRQLREHLNTHSGEKPFKCDECSSAFAKTSGLKEHKKLHTGIRKHICKVCGKGFTQIAGLATHKKIHLNSKKIPPQQDLLSNDFEFFDLFRTPHSHIEDIH